MKLKTLSDSFVCVLCLFYWPILLFQFCDFFPVRTIDFRFVHYVRIRIKFFFLAFNTNSPLSYFNLVKFIYFFVRESLVNTKFVFDLDTHGIGRVCNNKYTFLVMQIIECNFLINNWIWKIKTSLFVLFDLPILFYIPGYTYCLATLKLREHKLKIQIQCHFW